MSPVRCGRNRRALLGTGGPSLPNARGAVSGREGSAAEAEHGVRKQPIGAVGNQFLVHQAVVPGSWNRLHAVVGAGELAANGGDHVGVAAEIGGVENGVAKIAGRTEGGDCGGEDGRGAAACAG